MLTKKILKELQEYIDRHLHPFSSHVLEEYQYSLQEERIDLHSMELEDFIKNKRKPTLSECLFQFIDQKNTSDPVIYKKAGIDRKHFSKIRSNPNYLPKKNTIIALALALELNELEIEELLSTAGYSLSDSDTSDLVIQFCLEKKIYDIDLVNQALEYFSLKPLNGMIK
jgi:NPH3 family